MPRTLRWSLCFPFFLPCGVVAWSSCEYSADLAVLAVASSLRALSVSSFLFPGPLLLQLFPTCRLMRRLFSFCFRLLFVPRRCWFFLFSSGFRIFCALPALLPGFSIRLPCSSSFAFLSLGALVSAFLSCCRGYFAVARLYLRMRHLLFCSAPVRVFRFMGLSFPWSRSGFSASASPRGCLPGMGISSDG